MRSLITCALSVLSLLAVCKDKHRPAKDVVLNALIAEGFEAEDVSDLAISSTYASHNGSIMHTYFKQRYLGVELFNADIAAHILARGELLVLTHDTQ